MGGEDAIGAESKLCRNPKVTYRDLEEGGVLLHLETGAYHGLNSTGAVIWKLLEGEPTLGELLRELESRLDEPPKTLQASVTRLVERMRERDLVTAREA